MQSSERQKIAPKELNHFPPFPVSFPMELTCPICGYEVDLWSYEEETRCYVCGYKIFKNEGIVH